MTANKPYIWLGTGNGKYYLEVKSSNTTTRYTRTIPDPPPGSNCLQIIYKEVTYPGGSLYFSNTLDNVDDLSVAYPNFNPATHTRVQVLIQNSSGTTIGSCTKRISDVSQIHTPTQVKPYVWVDSNKIEVDADHNIEIPYPPPPNPIVNIGSLRTIACNDTGPSNNSTGWGTSATDFDPAVTSKIVINIKHAGTQVGETTSDTSDADGSGDNDLLDDFFD